MLLTKKIKLEISEQDAATLEFMQGKSRGLYNWWIGRLRNGEKWPGWKEAKATLQESKHYDPELHQVYGKLLAEVYFRIDKVMRDFYQHLAAVSCPAWATHGRSRAVCGRFHRCDSFFRNKRKLGDGRLG